MVIALAQRTWSFRQGCVLLHQTRGAAAKLSSALQIETFFLPPATTQEVWLFLGIIRMYSTEPSNIRTCDLTFEMISILFSTLNTIQRPIEDSQVIKPLSKQRHSTKTTTQRKFLNHFCSIYTFIHICLYLILRWDTGNLEMSWDQQGSEVITEV